MLRTTGLLACAMLWATAASSDAKCARLELRPQLITATSSRVPANGGVLVGWTGARDDDEPTEGDPSVRKSWIATVGKQPVELVIETLAPGLSVYRPKSTEPFALGDGKQQVGSFARTAATAPALPVPAVTSLVLESTEGRYKGVELSLSATFESVPKAAVAAILFRVTDKGRSVLSFGSVDRGSKTIVVDQGPHHCSFPPAGTIMPSPRDRVVLVWVDEFGRLSEPSKVLVVKPATPPKP